MLTPETGYCTSCRQTMWTYPVVVCPWCGDAAVRASALGLEDVDVVADPIGAIHAARGALSRMGETRAGLRAIRRQAATLILGDPELLERSPWLRQTLDKWAQAPDPRACHKGHLRSEHGTFKGGQWQCDACRRSNVKPRKQSEERSKRYRRRQRIRTRWDAYEERLRLDAERGEEARPARLRPELPPPVSPNR